jgi:hypothetical protein
MGVLTRFKQAIIAAAEASDDYDKIGYGDPAGARIRVEGVGVFERGKGWVKDKTSGLKAGLLDYLLEAISTEVEDVWLDLKQQQGGIWSMNGSGIPPTIRYNHGLVSVVKNEIGFPPFGTCSSVDITFLEGYINSYDFGAWPFFYGVHAIPRVIYIAPTTIRIDAVDHTGAALDLNNYFMGVRIIGEPEA